MANVIKPLSRTAAATSSTTLYSVPEATTTVVTNILVTNTSASSQTFTITLNSVVAFAAAPIAANTTAMFDLKQALSATQIIAGFASATSVNFHITGIEVA
jgi:hypothetical protein